MPIDPVTGLPPIPPPQAQQPVPGGYQPVQPGVPAGYQPRVYQPPTGPNIAPPRRGISLGVFVAVGVLAVLITVLMVLILVNPWGWQLPFIGEGLAAATAPAAEQTAETQPSPEATVIVVEPTVAVETTPLPTPTPQVVAPPNMVAVPGGAFQRGATDAEIDDATLSCIQEREDGQCFREWFTDAQPVEDITLSPFFIDVTEVTNLAYAECVAAGVCSAPENTEFYDDPAFGQHPVVYVNYDQAVQYCGWTGKRLPTEAEWEKAARYDPATGDEYRYPWGNSFEVGVANTLSAGQGGLTAVQAFPGDLSPNGVLGMAGNASEWVQDWYFGNYDGLGTLNPVRLGSQPLPEPYRVARGGNFGAIAAFARAAHRLDVRPELDFAWLSFRCAQSVGGEAPAEPVESPVEPAATEDTTTLPTATDTPIP
jgi:formylglycine-generating enzyme required for sulfatase activity